MIGMGGILCYIVHLSCWERSHFNKKSLPVLIDPALALL
jgi:hypothetical protein